MKKVLFIAGIGLLACSDASAQWQLTGNTVAPTDFLGTLNNDDLRFQTFNLQRGRITWDGHWDFGSNTFTVSSTSAAFGQNTIISSNTAFATGTTNIMDNTDNCLSAGIGNNMQYTNTSGAFGATNNMSYADNCFALGLNNTFNTTTGTANNAVVSLGGGNMIDASNESVAAGEDQHLVNGHGTFMGGGHSSTDGIYNISLGRSANTRGSVLHAYGADIFNDLDMSIVMGFSNNRTMTITDRGVAIQISPTAASTVGASHNLEVDANPSGGVGSNIAFLNLPSSTKYPVVAVDPSTGELYMQAAGGGGTTGISTACSTVNMMPKVSNTSGDLTCSQVYDDGSTVGINTTSGFTYTAGSGVFTAGAPGTQTVRLDVNGLTRSVTFAATSDAKFKTNITALDNSLDNVMKLKGVEYNWNRALYPNKDFDALKHSGFLAQELMQVLPNAVIKDENGDYAVDYNSIIPVLAEAIKEQQKQIEELKNQIAQQSTTGATQTQKESSFLAQNTPNPFSVATEIKYQLPNGTQQAQIGIYDMNGQEIKLFPLSANESTGSITIQGSELQPGMYLYTLIVDGKYFDSKRMVLTSQ